MHGNSTRRLVVASGGDQVVGHVGLHALGAFADRLGLGNAFSARIPARGERMPLHDRGKVLVQSMLMLAGGGESCADIEHLRAQEELFGSTPSDSTVFRAFHEITPEVRDALGGAFAGVRAQVWRRSSTTTGTAPVVLDIDASLVEIHTESKEGTGPHYKGGWGYHPMFCFADATGEALAGLLRPGNAGANTVADHVRVLDEAVAQLPAQIAMGHGAGDDAALVVRPLVVRTDSAGCTHGFVWAGGPATSGSSSWPAQTPRSTARSSTPSVSTRFGNPPSNKTEVLAKGRRWPTSASSSISRSGPRGRVDRAP